MQAVFKSVVGQGAQRCLRSAAKPLVCCCVASASRIFILLTVLSCFAAQSNSLPQVDEVFSVKSVFIDNSKFGKDPFFPRSARRQVVVDTSNTNSVVEPVHVTSLTLKGISGTVAKRLVIINDRTFEVGEEMAVRVANQIFKVRCVEIRDKSVIVSVNGQTKELFLGQRL